jgi:DNA-binding MarR family transcriptional regulator
MAAATSVVRAQQIVLAAADAALEPHGLTFSRFEALALLHFSRAGALPMGKMGQRLQVHPTSVTNAVDRLERDGLVRRVPSERDRRAVLAEITPRGRRVVAAAARALTEVDFGLDGLGEDALAAIQDAIAPMRRAAGDFVSPAPGRAAGAKRGDHG